MIDHPAQLAARISPHPQINPHARILVVDDADFSRDLFTAVLSKSGYEVATAVDGADALLRIAKERFDLVVTDWEMPILDGGRLVLALRSARLRIPVVMLSGAFAASRLPRVIAREVFAALEKPVSIFTFLATIAAALHSPIPPDLCAV